jgi:hypothetical protein
MANLAVTGYGNLPLGGWCNNWFEAASRGAARRAGGPFHQGAHFIFLQV